MPLLFDAAALVLFAVAAILLVVGRKWAGGRASTALVGAAVCALMGNADRLEMLKFSVSGGLEAKTRQLETGLEELRRLGALLGKIVVEADAARGRLGSAPTVPEHEALRTHVLEVLKSIGVPSNELSEVANSDRKWVIADYVGGILRIAESKVSPNRKPELQQTLSELNDIPLANWETRFSPDRLSELLSKFDIVDRDARELIEGYRTFLQTGARRQRELRDTAGH